MSQEKAHSVHEMQELPGYEMSQIQGGAVCHGVTVLAYARVDGTTLDAGDFAQWSRNFGAGG